MTTEHQKHRLTIGDAIAIGLSGAVVLLQLRLLSFCLIGLAAALLGLVPRLRCKPFCILAVTVIGVSLFLPFDVALGSYHFGRVEARALAAHTL